MNYVVVGNWWSTSNKEWKFAQGCGLWLFGEKLSIYVNFNGVFNEFVLFVQDVVCIFWSIHEKNACGVNFSLQNSIALES